MANPRHEAGAALKLAEGINDDFQERDERCKHCTNFCPYCDPDRYDSSIIEAFAPGESEVSSWDRRGR